MVYVGGRSDVTRFTVKRGLEAVAMTVMRYRCSAGETALCDFYHGLARGHEDDLLEAEEGLGPRWPRLGGRGASGRTSHP